MSNKEICEHIDQNKELIKKMIGTLYPSILWDEIEECVLYLSSKRNFSYVMGKEYS